MATRAILGTIPAGTVITTTDELDFLTPAVESVAVGITVTAASGTSPTLSPVVEVLGSDGQWYALWNPTTHITGVGQTFVIFTRASSNTAITSGASFPAVWTNNARLRLAAGGTTPSFTMSATVFGN